MCYNFKTFVDNSFNLSSYGQEIFLFPQIFNKNKQSFLPARASEQGNVIGSLARARLSERESGTLQ